MNIILLFPFFISNNSTPSNRIWDSVNIITIWDAIKGHPDMISTETDRLMNTTYALEQLELFRTGLNSVLDG